MIIKGKDLVSNNIIKWMGRTYYNNETDLNEIYHTGSGFEINFVGTKVYAKIHVTNFDISYAIPYVVIVIDNDFENAKTYPLDKEIVVLSLAEFDEDDKKTKHKVSLYKRTESIDSHIAIEEIFVDGSFLKKEKDKKPKIEFISDSGATGYGNMSIEEKTSSTSDGLNAYAFLTAKTLNFDVNIYAASGWGCYASAWTDPKTINVFDFYDFVDFKSNISWNHKNFIPDIIVFNLGTNDNCYIKEFSTEEEIRSKKNEFKQQYKKFIYYLHNLHKNAKIICLYGLMKEIEIFEDIEDIVCEIMKEIPNVSIIKILGDCNAFHNHPSLTSNKNIAKILSDYIKELIY